MQVVILCGGYGTRIRDVTEDVPKPMISIGNRPILWHIMKGYAEQGFKDFVLCLGYKSWTVKKFFLDYHLTDADLSVDLGDAGRMEVHSSSGQEDWRVTLVETGLDAMTGCRIKRIEKYITGDKFMLTYGDGVADVDLRQLVKFHESHGKLATMTAVQAPGRFGEIDLEGSQVVDFTEKPAVTRGRINGGYFVLNREVLGRLRNDPELVFEKAPLSDLAADGQLMAFCHDGFWHPMDNSRDYNYLNGLWNDGSAPWKTWQKRLRVAA